MRRARSAALAKRWSLPAALLALLDEHKYISRLLVMLEEQAAALETGRGIDLASIRAVMDYMTRYPDRYHHPKEDLIFARMEKADPATVKVTRELRRAHASLDEAGQAIVERLEAGAGLRAAATRAALRELLVDYVTAMRRHARYEEENIFEPAERLLTETDWREIDAAIAPVLDPVFGENKADEFLDLFGKYVNRIVPIATGRIPLGLFEGAAGTVERVAHASGEIRRLPGRIARHGTQRAATQLHKVTALLRSGSVDQAIAAMGELAATYAAGPTEYCALIRDAARAGDAHHEAAGNAAAGPPADADREHLAFRERAHRARQTGGVSWQAIAMNLLFRSTVKPLYARVTTENVEKIGRLMKAVDRLPADVSLERLDTDAFHAEWVKPDGCGPQRGRTILYLPGGGFFFPASARHVAVMAKLARRTGSRSLLVHYRLAPGHPFPAGLEDAVAAYRHLLSSGCAPEDIVVAGDSAGGGLCLSLLLALRQEQLPLPAGAALLSPLADLSLSGPSRQYNRWRDPLLPSKRRMDGFNLYTGETPRDHPLLSPVYGNFHGFPPMFAQVGSTEILLDDALRVARKARAQGVDFEVEVWDGMPHDWQLFPFIPESGQAVERIAAFFEKAWAEVTPTRRPRGGKRRRGARILR